MIEKRIYYSMLLNMTVVFVDLLFNNIVTEILTQNNYPYPRIFPK